MLEHILDGGEVDRDKSYCLDANYWKGTNIEQYLKKSRRQIVFDDYMISEKGLAKVNRRKWSKPKVNPDKTGSLSTVNNSGRFGLDAGTTLITYKDGFRRLTPTECERLQTVDDNFTAHVSATQRYKMLGNGWTVDVIAHIFSHLKSSERTPLIYIDRNFNKTIAA